MLFLLFLRDRCISYYEKLIKEWIKMLTIMRLFVPRIKDIHYSIMAYYCLEQSKYYCRLEDGERGLYWSRMACKYLLKRLNLLAKRGSRR